MLLLLIPSSSLLSNCSIDTRGRSCTIFLAKVLKLDQKFKRNPLIFRILLFLISSQRSIFFF